MSIRDLKSRSRLALHTALAVPALYVDLDTREETPCKVRVHTHTARFGDMAGFDYAPAERVAVTPKLIVLKGEVSPTRNGVFSVTAEEAYAVENVLPPDGLTVTIEATRMSQKDITEAVLPVPDTE